MRLTLRTLLAYIDDILDSSDQDEIRKKVDSSEFATDLLHKTRDTMQRLRLGAPEVMGGDGGLDPNTVAEYLDNALPPEQVGDFERVCLESDIHLAEVGSCHQILTMVLGEPAEIDPDSRQRMYDVPALAEQVSAAAGTEAGQDAGAGQVAACTSLPQAEPLEETYHVPDYLRESFLQRHRGKLAIAAVLLITAVVTFVLRTPEQTGVPSEMGGEEGLAEAILEPMIEDDVLGDAQVPSTDVETGTGDPNAPLFVPGPSAVDTMTGSGEGSESPVITPPGESDVATDDPSTNLETIPPAVDPPSQPSVELIPTKPDGIAARPGLTESSSLLNEGVMPSPGLDGGPGRAPKPEAFADEGEAAFVDTAPVPVEPAGPTQLATYLASGDILLRHDTETDAWIRLSPRAKLYAGDQLLAIPAFRPTIALASGIQVQLDGGTRIVLEGFDAPTAGEPARDTGEAKPIEVELVYGRTIFVSTMPGTATLSLRIGDQNALVQFDGAATLAVDILRELPAGADPLTSSAIVTAGFYATSGHLRWTSQGVDSIDIAPSSTWKVSADGMSDPEPLKTLDGLKWIDGNVEGTADRLAAPRMSDALEPGQPVQLRLSELTEDRRRELRSLAGRASMHVGYFEPFVAALNDSAQHAAWSEHINTLKAALALGPEVATQVREAFRRQKGNDGDDLFEMLWGYSDDDLRQDALAKLVLLLNHDSLDCRVLAFHNLRQLTGKRLEYRPQDPPQKRQRAIRVWNERLNADQLLP